MDINYVSSRSISLWPTFFKHATALLCLLDSRVWSSTLFLWSPGGIFLLLLQSVRLTAARRLLAQLQPIDGQSVGSSAQVALLSFALHIAFTIWSIGSLDLVTAVALCSELQTCVHVPSGGKRKEKALASLAKERQRGFTDRSEPSWRILILHRPIQIIIPEQLDKQWSMKPNKWCTEEGEVKMRTHPNVTLK